ncbi:hypothetical protein ABFA07_005374 [Porites harrisoni]
MFNRLVSPTEPIYRRGSTSPGQQQPQAVNMTPQPGMRPQFPTPTITKQQGVGAMGGTQNTPQQLPMQHLQQAVKLTASLRQGRRTVASTYLIYLLLIHANCFTTAIRTQSVLFKLKLT